MPATRETRAIPALRTMVPTTALDRRLPAPAVALDHQPVLTRPQAQVLRDRVLRALAIPARALHPLPVLRHPVRVLRPAIPVRLPDRATVPRPNLLRHRTQIAEQHGQNSYLCSA
jgi:hypothetical protein